MGYREQRTVGLQHANYLTLSSPLCLVGNTPAGRTRFPQGAPARAGRVTSYPRADTETGATTASPKSSCAEPRGSAPLPRLLGTLGSLPMRRSAKRGYLVLVRTPSQGRSADAARGQERCDLRGGRAVGSAVARVFAREGAKVHLAGRTLESLEEVAEEIRSGGGIDVSFNRISVGDVQGTPLAEMPLEDFERPVMTAVRSQFLTSRAAARHMISRGSGVILFFGGYGDPVPDYYLGGFQVALNAIESLRRQLASELGAHGIRAVTLQTGGVPETIPESFDGREVIT